MSINIEMQIKKSDSTYETLYPSTLGSLVSGKVTSATQADSATTATNASSATTSSSCTGNSATATKLATARNLKVSLSSTSNASFDGSSDATSIGVSGTLPVARGGTGYTSLSSLGSALSSYISASSVSGTAIIDSVKYTGNGSTYQNVSCPVYDGYSIFAFMPYPTQLFSGTAMQNMVSFVQLITVDAFNDDDKMNYVKLGSGLARGNLSDLFRTLYDSSITVSGSDKMNNSGYTYRIVLFYRKT